MIVAYDLRYAADHFTGIGTHAYCLLEALLELPGDERYLVLWDPRLGRRRYDIDAIARHPRVEFDARRIGPLHPASPIATGAWLRSRRPDAYLSPFYFLPEGAPCPVALTIHDLFPLRLPEGMSAAKLGLYRLSLWRASRARLILTSSEFSRREIVELMRVPEERVTAVRLGVPAIHDRGAARRPDAAPRGRFALVVGDNRPRKNFETLARAWAALGSSPPLALVSAGPAIDRYPSLADLAARFGAREVQGLGWVGEAELDGLYAHAEMVLFPSLYEGFGFPLAESFARGIPTLAADIPTLREIGDGVSRFVPPADSVAWAEAVRDLAGNESERDRMRAAGRRRAAELTYRATAERTLERLRAIARP